jgi:glucokinase
LIERSNTSINDFEGLMMAYQARDPDVLASIKVAAQALGETIKHIASILNIRQIRIAGNLSHFGDDLLDPIRQSVADGILPALADGSSVQFASLGEDIVLLGAASLVLKNELGVF